MQDDNDLGRALNDAIESFSEAFNEADVVGVINSLENWIRLQVEAETLKVLRRTPIAQGAGIPLTDDTDFSDPSGFIYVMQNPIFPHLLKIGQTQFNPDIRARQLESTGVPGRFSVECAFYVTDRREAEVAIHEHLDQFRPNKMREFFQIELGEACKELEKILEPFTYRPLFSPQNDKDYEYKISPVTGEITRWRRRLGG